MRFEGSPMPGRVGATAVLVSVFTDDFLHRLDLLVDRCCGCRAQAWPDNAAREDLTQALRGDPGQRCCPGQGGLFSTVPMDGRFETYLGSFGRQGTHCTLFYSIFVLT
jgi:hypothetical protein